jgi:hypothetical protein
MRQSRGLEREVGLLIVGVACWPGERRLQAGEVTELVARLCIGTPEDFCVQTDDVLGLEVYGLLLRVAQALTSTVARVEDAKRLAVLADHFPANSPNPSADFVSWSDQELTGRKLLHKDFAI